MNRRRPYAQVPIVGRRPVTLFDAMLERWQRGDEMSWGDLFAAWLKLPAAPQSREIVSKVIRKVEWIA